MQKILNIGSVKIGQIKTPVFLKAEIEGGKLSISGVIGPMKSGNCRGSCGQIGDTIAEYIRENNFTPSKGWSLSDVKRLLDIWERWHLNDMRPHCEHQAALGWPDQASQKVNTYQWRLNQATSTKKGDLEAEAIERAKTVDENRSLGFYAQDRKILSLEEFIKTDTPELPAEYTRYYEATSDKYGYFAHVEEKARGWINFSEDARGLLGKPCPECGYKYGSEWKKEALPAEVLEAFRYWPISNITPAWV